MRAVSNTSPISNLAIIGQLSLLKLQFSEILIPSAVLHELDDHPDPLALAAIQEAIRDSWIKQSRHRTCSDSFYHSCIAEKLKR